MKQLDKAEWISLFQLLETSTVKVKDAKNALTLLDKIDHNICEFIRKEQKIDQKLKGGK